MKGWKLQRPSGPNGYWEILDEDGNSIATLYGGADDKEIERKATLMVNAERMFEAMTELKEFYTKATTLPAVKANFITKQIENATNN